MQILLIEDDHDLAANLIDFLEEEGHEVDYAHSLSAAESLLEADPPAILVVDRMLPDGDGLQFVEKLRAGEYGFWLGRVALPSLPVIFLTARDLEIDKLDGFAAGADDYLVKPFSLAELGARILALSKRFRAAPKATATCGPLQLEEGTQRILLQGQALAIPPLQFQLLARLIRAYPDAASSLELTKIMWPDKAPNSNSLKVQLHGVRQKLAAADGVSVVTERGQGIRLVLS